MPVSRRPQTPVDAPTDTDVPAAHPQRRSAAPRPSVPDARPNPARTHVGGGMLPPPSNTVALSDGTRISFRAVEELPDLVD